MRAITYLGKIQTFNTKYRPNKDPYYSKGLYYRPRSLNKDPAGSTALSISVQTDESQADRLGNVHSKTERLLCRIRVCFTTQPNPA